MVRRLLLITVFSLSTSCIFATATTAESNLEEEERYPAIFQLSPQFQFYETPFSYDFSYEEQQSPEPNPQQSPVSTLLAKPTAREPTQVGSIMRLYILAVRFDNRVNGVFA